MIKVVSVEPLDNYKLRLQLSDGRKGIFDVSSYLNMGVFRELKKTDYFRRVYLDYGTVVWPHEQDIAPDTIEMDLQPEPALEKSGTDRYTPSWGNDNESPSRRQSKNVWQTIA
jgi:hypothetical protein